MFNNEFSHPIKPSTDVVGLFLHLGLDALVEFKLQIKSPLSAAAIELSSR